MRAAFAASLCAILGLSVLAQQKPFRYDVEYPFIKYTATPPAERVAALRAKVTRGELRLHSSARGYLDAVLEALDIESSSQTLVFSKTSLQTGFIRAATPRAIYFNDDTYVAYVPNAANLEIASIDPMLGPVFHTVAQGAPAVRFDRQIETCLACHDSFSLTGGGVPRFISGSGYTKPSGELVSHEAWILTTHKTPLTSRWGGWFVTGQPAPTKHLGNMLVSDPATLKDLDRARKGTLATLDGLVDTKPYITGTSDVVALLVLEHQITVQNAIVKANYDARGPNAKLEAIALPLLEALFLTGEAPLPGPIAGLPRFVEKFAARGRRDAQGRSLRDLDLQRRLFKYPLSYLIHSSAFQALPEPLRRVVDTRIEAILAGKDTSGKFAHLSADDRAAIKSILTAPPVR